MQAVFSLKTFIIFLQSHQLFWNLLPWLCQDSLQCKGKYKFTLRVMLRSLLPHLLPLLSKVWWIDILCEEGKRNDAVDQQASCLAYAPEIKAKSTLSVQAERRKQVINTSLFSLPLFSCVYPLLAVFMEGKENRESQLLSGTAEMFNITSALSCKSTLSKNLKHSPLNFPWCVSTSHCPPRRASEQLERKRMKKTWLCLHYKRKKKSSGVFQEEWKWGSTDLSIVRSCVTGGSRRSRLRPTHFLNLLHMHQTCSHAEHLCQQCPDVLHTIPGPKMQYWGSWGWILLVPQKCWAREEKKKKLDSDMERNELLHRSPT